MIPVPFSVFWVFNGLFERALWPSTYKETDNGNGTYNSPDTTGSDWQLFESELSTFLSDGIEFMTKFDDLITSLNNVSTRIDNQTTETTERLDQLEIANTRLSEIRTAIEALAVNSQTEDELEDIFTAITNVATILGAIV